MQRKHEGLLKIKGLSEEVRGGSVLRDVCGELMQGLDNKVAPNKPCCCQFGADSTLGMCTSPALQL